MCRVNKRYVDQAHSKLPLAGTINFGGDVEPLELITMYLSSFHLQQHVRVSGVNNERNDLDATTPYNHLKRKTRSWDPETWPSSNLPSPKTLCATSKPDLIQESKSETQRMRLECTPSAASRCPSPSSSTNSCPCPRKRQILGVKNDNYNPNESR